MASKPKTRVRDSGFKHSIEEEFCRTCCSAQRRPTSGFASVPGYCAALKRLVRFPPCILASAFLSAKALTNLTLNSTQCLSSIAGDTLSLLATLFAYQFSEHRNEQITHVVIVRSLFIIHQLKTHSGDKHHRLLMPPAYIALWHLNPKNENPTTTLF